MLVLKRKEGEAVSISPADDIDEAMTVKELFAHGPIKITINKIAGQISLGINAPQELLVLRDELV